MNTDLINCIENYFEWPENILVVDLREDVVQLREMYYRPWNPAPEIISKPFPRGAAYFSRFIKTFIKKGIPIAFITTMEWPHPEIAEVLSEHEIPSIEASEHGFQIMLDDLSNEPPPDTSNQTLLEIESDEHDRIRNINIPWSGPVSCNTDDITFTIKISSADKVLSETFRTKSRLTNLAVRIEHSFTRDKIVVEGTTSAGETIKISRGNPRQNLNEQLSSLNIVFDRTCVDDICWSEALSLAMDYKAAKRQTAHFNNEIRTAIISGIQEALSGESPNVSVWCVNDVHDALALPEWFVHEPPQSTCISEINRPFEELRHPLEDAFWLPGYDLWDPIGEALLEAVQEAKKDSSPIVIIGDSPPFPSNDPEDPIQDIRSAFGFQTTMRKYCSSWRQAIKEAQENQLPIIYIFLLHSRLSNTDNSSFQEEALLKTKQLENAICKALEKEPIHLVKERATKEGVHQALKIAKKHMFTQKTNTVIRTVR